jgi:hypothetical protein
MITTPLSESDVSHRRPKPRLKPKNVRRFVDELFGDSMHARRVDSFADGVSGVLHAASLAIHAIGRGLAAAKGIHPKHATKQVDRLLSNSGLALWRLFELWVQFVVGDRKEIVIVLDWTEFDSDKQATICLYLVTSHGRATLLVWKSVEKATLEGRRNSYETEVIDRLGAALAGDVKVTLLADRGFGDQKRYEHLTFIGWDYIIRFREGILLTERRAARSPLPNGSQRPAGRRCSRACESPTTKPRCPRWCSFTTSV